MTNEEFVDGLKDIMYRLEIKEEYLEYIVDDVKDLIYEFETGDNPKDEL